MGTILHFEAGLLRWGGGAVGIRPIGDVQRELVKWSVMAHPWAHVQASRQAAVAPHRRAVAMIAAGLGRHQSDELQVWKEVDGIFTADPRKVPSARVLASISPDEAAELTPVRAREQARAQGTLAPLMRPRLFHLMRVAPTQQALTEVLASTTWVHIARVVSMGAPEVPIEVRAPEKLVELERCLVLVEEDPQGVCMCSGDVALELHDGARLLAVLKVHHGVSISWDRWVSNGFLREHRPLLNWLASVGVPGPLEAYEKEQQRRLEAKQAEARWIQFMPPCLAPLWDRGHHGEMSDWTRLKEALVAAYPEPEERVRVLLGWFGQGMGSWRAFPAYEEVPEILLLDHPTQVIVSALSERDSPGRNWRGLPGILLAGRSRRRSHRISSSSLRVCGLGCSSTACPHRMRTIEGWHSVPSGFAPDASARSSWGTLFVPAVARREPLRTGA